MSRLAHATCAASGLEAERRNLDATVRHEAKQRAELRILAAGDAKLARQFGSDLNPFTTQGARDLWQKGWDGEPLPQPNAEGSTNWRMWERGRQARAIANDHTITAYYTDRANGVHAAKAP